MWGTELRFLFVVVIAIGFWAGIFALVLDDWRAMGRAWLATAIIATIAYHLIPKENGRKED